MIGSRFSSSMSQEGIDAASATATVRRRAHDQVATRRMRVLELVNAIMFTLLAGIALLRSRPRPEGVHWLVATFAILAGISWLSIVDLDGAPEIVGRLLISLIAVIPVLLVRFLESFVGPTNAGRFALVLAGALVVWTLAIPLPAAEQDGPPVAYVAAFLIEWVLVLGMVAWYFLRSPEPAPAVARRRARLLGMGALGLAAALVSSAALDAVTADPPARAVPDVMVTLTALAFLLGFAPPRWLRQAWRARETERVRQASVDALGATERRELLAVVLPIVGQLMGARIVELQDRSDRVIARWEPQMALPLMAWESEQERPEAQVGRDDPMHMRFDTGFGEIAVERAGFAPHFGEDEVGLARSLAAVMALGMTRLEFLESQAEEARRWRELSELKDDFIAMVAHDLRSPLSVVSGFADMLVEGEGSLDDAQRGEYLRIISRNSHRAATFIEDVLQVARMEAGKFAFTFENVDLADVITGVVDECRAGVAADHEVEVDVSELDDRAVSADRERMWQILVNLVSNAAKFAPRKSRIVVRASVDGDSVLVSVADQGPGIDPEDQERVFEKFTRVGSEETRRRISGTGMGLYICRELMRGQGGDISVESTPGTGTTFTCRLPLMAAVERKRAQ